MNSYTFMLNFTLPGREADPEQYVDALFEAGCDDAAVGVGRLGMIGLDFTREAACAEDALRSAIRNVRIAIPGAELVQAGPDLVGLTEMADIFGFSRQNMRRYATALYDAREAFPTPTVLGDPSLWHLAEIAAWLKLNTTVQPPDGLLEISKATASINFEVEQARVEKIRELA